ncbi:LysE/ArgO family amino acid transporter [Pontivivens insulae]|uniref:Arginine exporter protein ArgO n=1 Tax=Pontivivens insulae TaxID=1639689 RepID=A0A2R8A824_9RHOB|nr:LysE/ArgO family amino acid transporter [Pontivivens insulae]RED18481.1 L-lysine exporter family protein LysE/ArgO [Pontivivens insulae]SPF28379.1 Arginine exporter protein ArgO [Pontivivens insulae]
MDAALAGFFLSFGLILAIGAQNAFVLRQGIRGEFVLPVVLTCAISDALLITLGVSGFGAIMAAAPWVEPAFRWGGAAFLLYYAFRAARSAWTGGEGLDPAKGPGAGLRATILTCLALTWLNPHVYLDTVILLGSISTQYAGARLAFGAGAVTASFTFFFMLGFGASLLRPLFARPASWRVLDAIVALIMATIAILLISGH